MSAALDVWNGPSREALDGIEALHGRVGGANSPLLARQVNYAYTTSIVAHFQLYCREVHVEASRALVASVANPDLAATLDGLLDERRRLEKGNLTPHNLNVDFGRFGFEFWKAVEAIDRQGRQWEEQLAQLCEWRNAVVHGDVTRKSAEGKLMPASMTLGTCRDWRRTLGVLAHAIDRVVAARLQVLDCPEPW
jgi:hypothetical protein